MIAARALASCAVAGVLLACGAPTLATGSCPYVDSDAVESTSDTPHVKATDDAFTLPMVSVTFDDGWDGQAQAAAELEARGLRGTFYLTSQFLGRDGFLTADQAQAIAAAGHEIGDHTRTHPNLTRLSDAALDNEVNGARDELRALACGGLIPSFAAPSGDLDARVDDVVEASFESSRTVERGLNRPSGSVFHLKSNAMNSPEEDFIGEPPTYAAYLLQQAIHDGSWMILHFHQVVTGTPTGHIQYPLKDLTRILDMLENDVAAGRIAVVTVGEGVHAMRSYEHTSVELHGAARVAPVIPQHR